MGLGGCQRYNKEDTYQYTEKAMRRRVHKLKPQAHKRGGIDLLLTHAPAKGLNDGDDCAHRGFELSLIHISAGAFDAVGADRPWEQPVQDDQTLLAPPPFDALYPVSYIPLDVYNRQSMQYTKDRTNYQGKAYDFSGFDELTHFEWDKYSYMRSRNRPTGPGTRVYMRATTNPGGIGHGWVKARFITPAPRCV